MTRGTGYRSAGAVAALRGAQGTRAGAGLPFDVVVRMAHSKRRRALLRAEAVRQDELTDLMYEGALARCELWTPSPESRLGREWAEVKAALVASGAIRERRVRHEPL